MWLEFDGQVIDKKWYVTRQGYWKKTTKEIEIIMLDSFLHTLQIEKHKKTYLQKAEHYSRTS